MKLDAIDNVRPVRIVSSDSTGVVKVAFSDGSLREYVTYDAAMVARFRRLYGRDIAKFVRHLEALCKKPPAFATSV